jgi:hypothetical protein
MEIHIFGGMAMGGAGEEAISDFAARDVGGMGAGAEQNEKADRAVVLPRRMFEVSGVYSGDFAAGG